MNLSCPETNKLAGIQFFTDFMSYLHCPCVTGEKEYLLFLPQFHEETKRLPLPFFIESYKDIIQHYRQRFNLLAKSQRHSQPDGQIYLISRTGRPEFCAFSVVCSQAFLLGDQASK